MVLRLDSVFLFFMITAATTVSQTVPSLPKAAAKAAAAPNSAVDAVSTQTDVIPQRTLRFTLVDSNSAISVSPITTLPQCDSEGYLFLDMLDPSDLKKQTVVSFKGKESQTYSPTAIQDLHDKRIFGFYPSSSEVGFLVRGSKDLPGSVGPGKSPAGIAWSSYHNYIAIFDRDGSYKKSVRVPVSYQLSHFAIFPSGEFLVTGYDQLNSVVRLLLLSSSGQIIKDIDLPAARTPVAEDAPYRSAEGARAAGKLIGSLVFTPYKNDILVWHANSNDAILDISSGGSVREVPMQTPPGFAFAGMIPSNDRWVGHFRTEKVQENSPFTSETYSYFELRPQDASVSTKLLISGDVPQFIACESDGSYITYKVDKDRKMILLKSN